ncbi:TetR-like C-terminal domain-containing protein [[Mycobacterium] nativiensis]|uniref:TetR-like C-terminal domain-containing protein n=1 Tax=[Mycobacterium] nativiensis TaxID=2855503 RepID=A0ABU5XV46_9MYCO|nr:TetR-like C-terminal domain-containing protein [Mycolicibacter sp. MYC340]MEB3031798.1 TetR-like C-terminal domain-containing protein [Mycolicibacter sp. MYC340]
MTTIIPDISMVDTGSLRSDLIAFGMSTLELHFGPRADAFLRLTAEAYHVPELAARWETVRGNQITTARTIVRRAIRTGELPKGVSVTVLLDAIFGGILMHTLAVPPHLRDRASAEGPAHVEQLVDLALAGVAATAKCAGRRS